MEGRGGGEAQGVADPKKSSINRPFGGGADTGVCTGRNALKVTEVDF
jgi:uncharacterized spore protein YtfJ